MSDAHDALTEDTYQLRAGDGTALFVREVRPSGPVRGRLAFIHGFAEHGGRYAHVLEWFARRGFATAVVDLRGHGRSAGRRTFVRRFAEYLDDAATFLRHAGERPEPLVAVGHSMGGLVLSRTLQDHAPAGLPRTLRGAVITSPYFALKMALPRWKVAAGRGLSRVLPWLRLPADLDVSHLSSDPAVGQAYLADPLVSSSATARWFTETVAAHAAVLERAPRLELPILVMHGEADAIADPAGAEAFFAAAGSRDKQLRLWPDLRHELFNELAKEEVLEHVLAWVEARLPAPAEARQADLAGA